MKKCVRKAVLTLILLSLGLLAHSQSYDRGLDNAYLFGRSETLSLTARMIINGNRGTSERTLEVLAELRDRTRVYFGILEPAFLRETKFLQIRDQRGATSQWMKTSRGVRRLSSGDGDEPVFQSDFTAEDLSVVALSDFHVDGPTSSTLEGEPILRWDLRPIRSGGTYTLKEVYVRESTGLIVGIDFFVDDVRMKEYRVLESREEGGYEIPTLMMMTSLLEGSSTEIDVLQVSVDTPISGRYFNPNGL